MEGPSPRIVKETKTIQSDPVPGITFQPDSNNYKHFFIEVMGITTSIKVLLEPATMEVALELNFFFLMITPCLLLKWSLILKFTTPISVDLW